MNTELDFRISVIIPTLNASAYLPDLLTSLSNQTVKPYEVIVIDSTSDDHTAEIAKEMNTVLLTVERKSFDHGGTRNYAASMAKGDVYVFITQDAKPSNEFFLEQLILPFRDPEVVAVCGRQIADEDSNVLDRLNREFNYPIEPMKRSLADIDKYGIKTFFYTNVCSAIRKKEFLELGGYPEPIVSNEDMILAARCILAGYSIAYAPKASVVHSHELTLKQIFGRYFDIGGSLRMNSWILNYAQAEGEGIRLIKNQFRQLRKPSYWRWIPRWVGESVAKFVGYRLGLLCHIIPIKICQKFSLHPFFWEQAKM